jgi:16S rRNA (cytosine967-C5)-methyltransferase
MTPSARIQAASLLLEQIFSAWQSEKRIPADKLLQAHFKENRYIGSKDRGAISELVYWVLRHKATLEWWLAKYAPRNSPEKNGEQAQTGRAFVIAALILRHEYTPQSLKELCKDGNYYSFPALTVQEEKLAEKLSHVAISYPDMPEYARLNYPQWFENLLKDSFGEQLEAAMLAMSEQAPTDLRVNTLKTTREKLLANLNKEGFECAPTPLSNIGIRLARRSPIFTSEYFKQGHFEVQDEGSQAIALLVDAKSGERVIDFCAGAGGKTLAIAAMMENKGRILAWDISEKRLSQINLRLKRAGVNNVQVHVLESESDSFIKRHKATADKVLVDAPCSGSGTWRRNPDLKWRFTQKDLDEVIAVQKSVLQSAGRLVKVGGRLIYATCSVFKDENERQIDLFLKNNPYFKLICAQKIWNKEPLTENDAPAYFSVTPHENGVDGFFAAILERLPA